MELNLSANRRNASSECPRVSAVLSCTRSYAVPFVTRYVRLIEGAVAEASNDEKTAGMGYAIGRMAGTRPPPVM